MNFPKFLKETGHLQKVLTGVLFFLALIFNDSSGQYYLSACRSVGGKLGTCVELSSCPLFFGWLKQRPLVKDNLRLLVKFTCSFNKDNPKVCCPNESLFVQDDFRLGSVNPNRREISSSRPHPFPNTVNRVVFPTSPSALLFPDQPSGGDEEEKETRIPPTASDNDPFFGDRGSFPDSKKQHVSLTFPGDSSPFKSTRPLELGKPPRIPLKNGNANGERDHLQSPKRDLRYHPNFRLIPRLRECSNAVKLDSLLGTYGGYPWLALVGKKKRRSLDFDYECGGAIINNRYVVSAASCFRRAYTYVRVGEYDLNTLIDQGSEFLPQSRREDYRIEKLTIHPDYDPARGANDIALLRLDKQLALNTTFIRPVCLPFLSEYGIPSRTADLNNLDGKAFWVAGWAQHSWDDYSSGSPSSVLQDGIVESTGHEQCRYDHPFLSAYDSKTQICVGGKGRRNSCVADTGGPLMLPLKVPGRVEGFMEPKYFMLGLLSRGPSGRACESTGNLKDTYSLPTSVYTKISKYLTWILDNIQD